jgi:hypothetical protein
MAFVSGEKYRVPAGAPLAVFLAPALAPFVFATAAVWALATSTATFRLLFAALGPAWWPFLLLGDVTPTSISRNVRSTASIVCVTAAICPSAISRARSAARWGASSRASTTRALSASRSASGASELSFAMSFSSSRFEVERDRARPGKATS